MCVSRVTWAEIDPVTAYGKTRGAVVLTGHEPWNDEGVIVLAGESAETFVMLDPFL